MFFDKLAATWSARNCILSRDVGACADFSMNLSTSYHPSRAVVFSATLTSHTLRCSSSTAPPPHLHCGPIIPISGLFLMYMVRIRKNCGSYVDAYFWILAENDSAPANLKTLSCRLKSRILWLHGLLWPRGWTPLNVFRDPGVLCLEQETCWYAVGALAFRPPHFFGSACFLSSHASFQDSNTMPFIS